MKRFSIVHRSGIAVAVAAMILLIGGCKHTNRGEGAVAAYQAAPLTVPIPGVLDPDVVDAESRAVLVRRGWAIVESEAGNIRGRLVHRGYDSTVSLKQEDGMVWILVDSVWADPRTGRTRAAVPRGWLENLQQDLIRRLERRSVAGR